MITGYIVDVDDIFGCEITPRKLLPNKYSSDEKKYDTATTICRAKEIFNTSLFLNWSDNADASKSYEKRLTGLAMQTNERNLKRQKINQASEPVWPNKNYNFRLQEVTMVTSNETCS